MKQFTATLLILLFILGCEEYEITDLELRANKTEIVADGKEAVTFTVVDANGRDVTSEVQIYNNLLPFYKKSFTSDTAGVYNFYAEFDALVSNSITIKVNPLIKHQKNVLIEDYTGTWCGYCPRVSNAIEEALELSENIVVVAIHDDREMLFPKLNELKTEFGVEGLPTAIIDRNYKWPFPESFSGLRQSLSEPAKCGISLETDHSGKLANIEVKVEFARGYIANTKLVVYVTQNNLYYNQANYYPELGSNPIINFKHDNVLRLSLTDILGDVIENDINTMYVKNFQFFFENVAPEDVKIVAFVVDETSNMVINSRGAILGTNAGFQLIK